MAQTKPSLLQKARPPKEKTTYWAQHAHTHLSRAAAGGARGLGLEGAERSSGGLDDHSGATALPARVGFGARFNATAIAGVAPFQVADANLGAGEGREEGGHNNEMCHFLL